VFAKCLTFIRSYKYHIQCDRFQDNFKITTINTKEKVLEATGFTIIICRSHVLAKCNQLSAATTNLSDGDRAQLTTL